MATNGADAVHDRVDATFGVFALPLQGQHVTGDGVFIHTIRESVQHGARRRCGIDDHTSREAVDVTEDHVTKDTTSARHTHADTTRQPQGTHHDKTIHT